MKRIIVFFLALLLLMPTLLVLPRDSEISGESRARNPAQSYFFDFGEARSPVMNGYTGVAPEDDYDAGKGYGLLSTVSGFQVTQRSLPEYNPYVLQRSWVYNEYATDMSVDGLRSQEDVVFKLDLEDGNYRVRLWLGDLEKAVYSMNVSYNGNWLTQGAFALHTAHRGVYYTDKDTGADLSYGCAYPYTQDIMVEGGSLVLNITGNDSSYQENLTLEREKDPANSYLSWMSTATKKYSSSTGPWRFIGGPFSNASVLGLEVFPVPYLPITGEPGNLVLDERNVGDQDLKDGIATVNAGNWQEARATWDRTLGKRLFGAELVARAQLGLYLAGTLEMDLEMEVLPHVKKDLEDAAREKPRDIGVKELRLSLDSFQKGLNYYLNRGVSVPDARQAKNHFYEAGKGIMRLWQVESKDPLYLKAQLWSARALYSLDPHRWTSASGTAADIMEFILSKDPDNVYARFYTQTTREENRTWENGTSVLSTIGENDTWFLEDYNKGFEDAPKWAKLLREELCWLYNITDWWVDNKQQPDGSIGGGWTDDVEMIGLFGFDALISQGADEKSMEGAKKFVSGMLASGQVDMDKGYSAAFADTEHSAELTGDSLPMMVATDFGNPYWLNLARKTAVLMNDLWMGENEKGHLQFKANHLSATRVGTGGQAEDSWVNFRAALPAFWVWWYSRDPAIEELFVSWAEAWVDAAMSTEKNKPEGVVPAMIAWPTGEIGGLDAPTWYEGKNDGSVNYKWERLQYKSYITTLLVSAFEATGNLSFLEPLRLEAQLAQDYIDNHPRYPVLGSADWAGMILGQKAVDRYQKVLDSHGLPGGAGSPELWNPDSVVAACENGHDYIEKCYPLMTTEASATDRVAFVGIANPFLIYTGGSIGGALLSPSVTYSGFGRDFAAMVRATNHSYTNISLYGFFKGVQQGSLMFWDLEPGAIYTIRGGLDADGNGLPDSIDQSQPFLFSFRGMEIPLTIPGNMSYALEIVRIEKGQGLPLFPDPAFGDEDIIVDKEQGKVKIRVHNIGSAPATNLRTELWARSGDQITFLGQEFIPELPAPSGLQPASLMLEFNVSNPQAPAEEYIFLLDPSSSLTQISSRNDRRDVPATEMELTGLKVNQIPTVEVTQPAQVDARANENYTITWTASDPDDEEMTISLYRDSDTNPYNGIFPIEKNLPNTGSYLWDLSEIENGSYYILVLAEDSRGGQRWRYSEKTLLVDHGLAPSKNDDKGAGTLALLLSITVLVLFLVLLIIGHTYPEEEVKESPPQRPLEQGAPEPEEEIKDPSVP